MCGDSTNPEDISKLMDGELADLWLTDPPYNVSYEGGTKEKLTILNDNKGDDEFREFLIASYAAANANMKGGQHSIYGMQTQRDTTSVLLVVRSGGRFESVLYGRRTQW